MNDLKLQFLQTRFFFLLLFLLSLNNLLIAQTQIRDTILHDGLLRNYILYIPDAYDGSEAVPLLFNLHGYTSYASQQLVYGDFRPIADTANFIIVHPNGTEDGNGDQYWNVGFSFRPSNVDDLGFIELLRDTLSKQYQIDSTRIYSTGMSNGGYMSYKLACESSGFAGIASVTGSMSNNTFNNCTPPTIPVMQIHGTNDASVPYNGGLNGLAIEAVIDYWVEENNCDETPVIIDIPNRDPNDGATTQQFVYLNGDNNVSVELFKVTGGGHTWPGAPPILPQTTQDFSASKEIWRFFSQGSPSSSPTSISSDEKTVKGIFEIYPNPAQDFLFINYTGITENFRVKLFDLNGRILLTQNQLLSKLNLSNFNAGIYLLQIEAKSEIFTKKIVVK